MNKFQVKRDPEVMATHREIGLGVSSDEVIFKSVGNADLADVNRRVTNRTGDGDVQDLARRIAVIYRQTIAGQTGVSTMSLEERRAMRDRLVAAMTEELDSPFPNDRSQPTPALVEIASLLAGLTDEVHGSATKASESPAQSSEMAGLRQRIIELGKVVEAYIERRAATRPAKFQTDGVSKADTAGAELQKALANGKPATWD